jgi:two-component sensor histidine kinase
MVQVGFSSVGDGIRVVSRLKEVGGPTATVRNRQGFGSQLIAASAKALSGTIQSDFSADGFTCSLTFPLSMEKHAA